nr:MAG TPA: hypothetical protein [Caudoviricetes sp.]
MHSNGMEMHRVATELLSFDLICTALVRLVQSSQWNGIALHREAPQCICYVRYAKARQRKAWY